MGDVAIITCKKGAGTSAMPSKTFSIMACNTPIVASFDGDSELAEVLAAADAGVCVEPENAEALAEAILDAEKRRPRVNSREFLKETADRRISVGKYIKIFEDLSCRQPVR